MSIATYPTTPKPFSAYVVEQKFNTLMGNFDSGAEQRRRLIRFSRRNFSLQYRLISAANRNILHDFYRARYGSCDPFWYVDFRSASWTGEYVGRGGPLPLLAAIQDDGGTYTDETDDCHSETTDGMHFLTTAPAVNDAYYVGSLTPFDKATFVITSSGNWTGAYTWELYTGSSWATAHGISDGTNNFEQTTGSYDVTFTSSTQAWTITSVNEIDAYWLRARVSSYTTYVALPKGGGATVNSKLYDLHCVNGSSAAVTIYIDGTSTTAWAFNGAYGAAGADRIIFTNYPSTGSLITSDITGYLRVKGRFANDSFPEDFIPTSASTVFKHNTKLDVTEIQW